MSKTLIVIVISIFVLIGLVFLFFNKVGDVRPALLPSIQMNRSSSSSPEGERVDLPLKIPDGYTITYYAQDLGSVRDLQFSPEGTLLASVPNEGKVIVLPENKTILSGLGTPHGLAFYNNYLYVAEEVRVSRYKWDEVKKEAVLDKKLVDLPGGGSHVTRSLVFNKDGKMFVSIGSTCNVCIEKHEWLAAVISSDWEGNSPKLFAKGLRNTVFLTIHPQTNELWGADMGRDNLGDDIPSEEINILREGKDYGWPICYEDRVHDTKFDTKVYVQDSCSQTEIPIYKIQAHSAPLGHIFDSEGNLLLALHGSWNRSAPVGYKVIKLKVEGNKIVGQEDFLSGFLEGSQTYGRPVDLTFDKEGRLYLSDDKAGAVYQITK